MRRLRRRVRESQGPELVVARKRMQTGIILAEHFQKS